MRRRPPPIAACRRGGRLDGIRPPRSAIDCLAAALRAERAHVDALATARHQVVDCVQQARAEGSTYSAIATAIVPATGRLRDTTAARRRLASALACRVFEARRRANRS